MAAAILLLALLAPEPANTIPWSDKDRKTLVSDCLKPFTDRDNNLPHALEKYCRCFQRKVESRYPSLKKARRADSEDTKKVASWAHRVCTVYLSMDAGPDWSREARQAAMAGCLKERGKSKAFCSCIVDRMENRGSPLEWAKSLKTKDGQEAYLQIEEDFCAGP